MPISAFGGVKLRDLNTVNELIEYGFIGMNERRKIFLHFIMIL